MKLHKEYSTLAKYYDLLHQNKNYKKDLQDLLKIISKYKKSVGNDLLEIACGTGKYLSFLQDSYICYGIDNSFDMLKVAKKNSPKVTFVQADMQSFNLNKKFDVILCLFSSIAFATTKNALENVIERLAKHTKKNGIVVIEPFLNKEEFKSMSGTISMRKGESENVKIVRMAIWGKGKNFAVFTMNYLIGEKNKNVTYLTDKHKIGLFDLVTIKKSLNKSGYKTVFLKKGLEEQRGLWIGIKK